MFWNSVFYIWQGPEPMIDCINQIRKKTIQLNGNVNGGTLTRPTLDEEIHLTD